MIILIAEIDKKSIIFLLLSKRWCGWNTLLDALVVLLCQTQIKVEILIDGWTNSHVPISDVQDIIQANWDGHLDPTRG